MGRRTNTNVQLSAVLLVGLGFIVAGAFVPDEETIALGLFLMLAASAVLMGLNWPKPRPSNLVSMAAFRQARQRQNPPSPDRRTALIG
ncbi:hypothetical protein [Sphingomonas sp. PR090111-T3T-6A]|uniref:hypothetical protein n=1 Tax=Sphingomonas sp. PR090111-T3T-6A TaxID=685778 RepID=UPI0012FBE91D|nr:hypothetical protein [Sphingomonas sp. PR090111-T3T-6A]